MPPHRHLPKPKPQVLRKQDLLNHLVAVDNSKPAWARISRMEVEFRRRIANMSTRLPSSSSQFDKFNTNPYVLLMFAAERQYSDVSQLEPELAASKIFSSLETAAGRMVEEVTLPIYGWVIPASGMHSAFSAIDGMQIRRPVGRFATLKSGPRCLNDPTSENLAIAVLDHARTWAQQTQVQKVEFTYGALYGTPKKSNKKDWHILKNIVAKAPNPLYGVTVLRAPVQSWSCRIDHNGIPVESTVRIGLDWWNHLGGPDCALEVWIAMIRACIAPAPYPPLTAQHVIPDIAKIVSTAAVPNGYNVRILQQSQLPWLFFVARHFCDDLR